MHKASLAPTWVSLFVRSQCNIAAMLFKTIYRWSKWNANRNLGVYGGINASGGVWRQQCPKMYDGNNALQKHIQMFEVYYSELYFCCILHLLSRLHLLQLKANIEEQPKAGEKNLPSCLVCVTVSIGLRLCTAAPPVVVLKIKPF